jgi:glycosyltransferase involved in cell wall biosynthesis
MYKVKIVIIVTDFGSFNNFLSELAIQLSQANEVHVISSESKVIKIYDKYNYAKSNLKFHIVDIPRSPSFIKLVRSAFHIRKIIESISPKLIYAHFTTGIFPTVIFKKTGVEYWGAFHGLGMNASTGKRKILFSIVELISFYRLDKRFLINSKDFELVSKLFKENTFKYNSNGVGCDIKKFDQKRFTEIDKLKLKLDLNIDNKFVITYTGRFVEFKGFDLVYRSFVKLTNEFPDKFILLLIGDKDEIHLTGLTKQEEIDLIKDRSIIHVGYISEVETYLSISDVFLFPSKKEGLPVCIVEALAMGVPVITLDERGNSDIVKEDLNGYLIQSVSKTSDVNEIVKKLKYLYFNRNILKKLSLNCLKNRKTYSREVFIDEQLHYINNFKLKVKSK